MLKSESNLIMSEVTKLFTLEGKCSSFSQPKHSGLDEPLEKSSQAFLRLGKLYMVAFELSPNIDKRILSLRAQA